jgi:predicted Zn-dependent protease with MMP-like domain
VSPPDPEPDPDLEATEAVYDALDRGDAEQALALAQGALAAAGEDDAVLRFLAGRALLELDRPTEASRDLLAAVSLDPDDAEFHAYAAWSLFRACRFDTAWEHVRHALSHDDRLPEAHWVHALLLERRGRPAEAERAFERAAALDPEWFPRPTRVDDAEFDRRLAEARAGLDETFRRHLDAVEVLVDDLPSEELLCEQSPPLDPEQLLGLFTGMAVADRSAFSAGAELPPRILLFRRNLERHAQDPADLAEQIQVTLYHELGHYLGLDEEDLDGLGYG